MFHYFENNLKSLCKNFALISRQFYLWFVIPINKYIPLYKSISYKICDVNK